MLNTFIHHKVVVLNHAIQTMEKAYALSQRLNLPFNPPNLSNYLFALSFHEGRLVLSFLGKKQMKPIWTDLSQLNMKRASIKYSLIAKAVGIKPNREEKPTILDACAGLGIDGLTLALLGCQVTFLERSPIVFELLKDGLDQIKSGILKENPTLLCMDAMQYLNEINQNYPRPDVIYLDPMYPERDKHVLSKKEMQILHHLVGDDLDADDLLEKALQCAKKRVVVKRRRLDAGNKKPDLVYLGKAVRFDVYLF